MSRPPICNLAPVLFSTLLVPGTASAQNGFEWDYADGLGVRYLLYNRIERKSFDPEDYPAETRAVFLPKSKSDWVRLQGTPLAWGVQVYEFKPDEAGFGEFLRERDPRRTFREFRIDGKPRSSRGEKLRYWEFIDTWRPFVEVLDSPQPRGPFRYAVSPELGIRFLAHKTMDYVGPFVATDGDNCFARLHPAPAQWLRVDGPPGPVAWMIRVHVFPDMPRERSSSDRDDTVASFVEFADRRDPRRKRYRREFLVRDQEVDGEDYRLWRWTDQRADGKTDMIPCYHTVAAVYRSQGEDEREIALLGIAPADGPERRPEPMDGLERMVTSVEPWSGKATDPGFSFYNVAASCASGDREIGILIHLPTGTDTRPDRELLGIARRMARSLQPETRRR